MHACEVVYYTLDHDQRFLRKLSNGSTVPYIGLVFHRGFMERMHAQFKYLTYGSISNAVETRAWLVVSNRSKPVAIYLYLPKLLSHSALVWEPGDGVCSNSY